MKATSVYLPPSLEEAVKLAAERDGRSISNFIVQLLTRDLSEGGANVAGSEHVDEGAQQPAAKAALPDRKTRRGRGAKRAERTQ